MGLVLGAHQYPLSFMDVIDNNFLYLHLKKIIKKNIIHGYLKIFTDTLKSAD